MSSFLETPALLPTDRNNSLFIKLPFPWKLYQLLEDAEKDGNQHIISWQSNQVFKVHDTDLFTKQIMRLYFRQTKYRSFTRQLYVYGFMTIQVGEHRGGYTHPNFLRGDQATVLSMERRVVERGQVKIYPQRNVERRSMISSSIKALSCEALVTNNSPMKEWGEGDTSSTVPVPSKKRRRIAHGRKFCESSTRVEQANNGTVLSLSPNNPRPGLESSQEKPISSHCASGATSTSTNNSEDWLEKLLSTTVFGHDFDLEPRSIEAMMTEGNEL